MTTIKSYIVTNSAASQSGGGGSGTVTSIVAGDNMSVDNTDPANPIVNLAADGTLITDRTGNLDKNIPLENDETLNTRLILEENQEEETGDFVLSADDAYKTKYLNSATPQNITFPDNTSVPIAIDTVIKFRRVGAGQYSFVAGGGVTINTSKGTMVDAGLDAEFQAVKTDTNEWYVDNGLPVSITSADVTGALGYTPSKTILLYKDVTPASHTGNTTETILGQYLVPAGTILADDIIVIRARIAKTLTNGSYNGRIRIGSAGTTADAQVAIVSPGATQLGSYFKRDIHFLNAINSQEILSTTLNAATDEQTTTTAPSALSIDFSAQQYISLSINLNSGSDTGILKFLTIQIIRS